MSINLNDFLGLHLVLLWIAIALMLAALELLRRDWTIAVLAAAALVAALVALVAPHAWYAQLFVFAILAAVGEVILHRRRATPTAAGGSPTDSV